MLLDVENVLSEGEIEVVKQIAKIM